MPPKVTAVDRFEAAQSRLGRWAIVASLLGVSVGIALVGYYGFANIGSELAQAGWTSLLTVSVVHAAVLGLAGIAWWVLAPPKGATLATFAMARLVREAGSEALPLSPIGGYVLGARILTIKGLSSATSIATLIADASIEVATQIGFVAIGVMLLFAHGPDASLWLPMTLGSAVTVIGTAALFLAQRPSARILQRIAEPLARRWFGRDVGWLSLEAEIHAIYRDRAHVLASAILHFACWVATGAETWLALNFLGVSISFANALGIEALLYAICGMAFFVPGAWGVQESAHLVLGALFGLPPEAALALSILKRGRDLLIGIPSLVLWQFLEGHRFLNRRRAATTASRGLRR